MCQGSLVIQIMCKRGALDVFYSWWRCSHLFASSKCSSQQTTATFMICKRWPGYRTTLYLCSGLVGNFCLVMPLLHRCDIFLMQAHQTAQAGSFSNLGFLPILPFSHILHTTLSVLICFNCSIIAFFFQMFFGQKREEGDARVQICNCSLYWSTATHPQNFTRM